MFFKCECAHVVGPIKQSVSLFDYIDMMRYIFDLFINWILYLDGWINADGEYKGLWWFVTLNHSRQLFKNSFHSDLITQHNNNDEDCIDRHNNKKNYFNSDYYLLNWCKLNFHIFLLLSSSHFANNKLRWTKDTCYVSNVV